MDLSFSRSLRWLYIITVLTVALTPSIYGQASHTARTVASPAEVALSVGGEVEQTLKLTAADLGKLPRLTVRAKDHI